MASRAPALHPVLELPPGVVKRPVDRFGGRLGPFVARRHASDEDLMAGKTEANGDVEAVPVAVMLTRQFDDDVTGDDAVEEVFELLGAKPDLGSERVRAPDAPERELKGDMHWEDRLSHAHYPMHTRGQPMTTLAITSAGTGDAAVDPAWWAKGTLTKAMLPTRGGLRLDAKVHVTAKDASDGQLRTVPDAHERDALSGLAYAPFGRRGGQGGPGRYGDQPRDRSHEGFVKRMARSSQSDVAWHGQSRTRLGRSSC